MATAVPSADESVFDAMTEQIIAAFDRIMKEVISRRDQLILEVEDKRKYFKLKNSAMLENVRELEEMRSHLEKMSLKQNLATKKKDESLVEIDSEIDKLKTDMLSYNQLKYSCPLDQLIGQVKQFGEIIDEASNLTLSKSKYCQKLTAVKVISGFDGRKFCSRIKFHLDIYKELLYIFSDSTECNTLVFNVTDFAYVAELKNIQFYTLCVATSKEFIYVGYSSLQLCQFKPSDYSKVRQISVPSKNTYRENIDGLAVCSENRVLVLNHNCHLFIYDRVLNLKEEVVLNLERFGNVGYSPTRLRLIENRFYMKYEKSILAVTYGDWDNIKCLFNTEKGIIPYVKCPYAFCIDQAGNIIVADSATNSIKFLSPEGELIHTIGEETVGSDDIQNCLDLLVYKDSVIVACYGCLRLY